MIKLIDYALLLWWVWQCSMETILRVDGNTFVMRSPLATGSSAVVTTPHTYSATETSVQYVGWAYNVIHLQRQPI